MGEILRLETARRFDTAKIVRLERAIQLAARQTALASLAAQEYPGAEEARAELDAELAALRDEADTAGDWPT